VKELLSKSIYICESSRKNESDIFLSGTPGTFTSVEVCLFFGWITQKVINVFWNLWTAWAWPRIK